MPRESDHTGSGGAQKAVTSAVGIIPLTIAGFALLRCGCAFAASAIEFGVGCSTSSGFYSKHKGDAWSLARICSLVS